MTQINAKVECVLDCRDKLGEGILWCPVERALYWVDVPMPSYLHRWDPKTGRPQNVADARDDHLIGEA